MVTLYINQKILDFRKSKQNEHVSLLLYCGPPYSDIPIIWFEKRYYKPSPCLNSQGIYNDIIFIENEQTIR